MDAHQLGGSAREHEVIVIGTGFGGAVAACRLAQAGFEPLVLERGRRYGKGDFPALPRGTQIVSNTPRLTWARDQGLWDVVDLGDLISVQAAGYGGGSLVYANVHLMPPREVFDTRWPVAYKDRSALDPYFDLAGYMLDAAPMKPVAADGLERPTKTRQLELIAERLQRSGEYFYPPLTVRRHPDGENDHGRFQRQCIQCGSCCSGCPIEAKNTLDFNYLAEAERPSYGARFLTQCEVVDLEERSDAKGTLWHVHYHDHLRGIRDTLVARHVFLCAGSVHTTRLMARLFRSDPTSVVGAGYYPGAAAVGMVVGANQAIYPSEGPAITSTLVHWDSVVQPSFFMLQDGGYAHELERLMGVFAAPLWLGRNRIAQRVDQPPRPDEPGFRPPYRAPQFVSPPVPSALEGMLDALAGGSFDDVVPAQLRRAVPALLDEALAPLLMPELVSRTIDASIAWFIENKPPFCWFSPEGRFNRRVTRILKQISLSMGDEKVLAGRSLRAALTLSGLDRGEVASRVLGYSAQGAEHRLLLLAMGRDTASGVLSYDVRRERMTVDLDTLALSPRYSSEERLMADIAGELGGELRMNPVEAYLGKAVAVHNQGGCRMSDRPEDGVVDADGKVHGKEGLYILDGSALCTSVGVNPSATITALAERNVLRFIRKIRGEGWPDQGGGAPGAQQYQIHVARGQSWANHAKSWDREPPKPEAPSTRIVRPPLSLTMREWLHGYIAPATDVPDVYHGQEDVYRRLEGKGRPEHPLVLELQLLVRDLSVFFEDVNHTLCVRGKATLALPGEVKTEHSVEGRLLLFAPRRPPAPPSAARSLQERLAKPAARQGRTGRERYIEYELTFVERPRWRLHGYKRIMDHPGLDAWRDTTTLFVRLMESGQVQFGGAVHIDLTRFLYQQIHSIEVGYAISDDPFEFERDAAGYPCVDPARATWAALEFATFFFGTLQRIYMPDLNTVLDSFVRRKP